ncbi:MAG: hypothetical protein MJ156_02695 [Alphaproteobacteria bacterium]|nr:hypothetical protein [Alphaproteobacteria bacterium]
MPYKRQLTMKNEKPINSEHDLQKRCVELLRAHNMLCIATDVFNGIGFIRDIPHKAIYKQHVIAMGATPGQPDLIIMHNKEVTFVEFKYGKGKKSENQVACCNLLEKMGYEVLEWRELEQCREWIVSQIKDGSVNKLK